MPILLLLPVLILLGGALLIALTRLVRFPYANALPAIVSILAVGAMIPLATSEPLELLISAWQPLSVLSTPVALRVEPLMWLLSLIAIVISVSTAFATVTYTKQRHDLSWAVMLAAAAAFVTSTFSANLLTLAIIWGVFDALLMIAQLLHDSDTEDMRHAAIIFAFNIASTSSVWIAALIINQAHHSQFWHLIELPESARAWLALAAVLRLGLYPLNRWLLIANNETIGREALLYALSPLAGLYLLIRLASLDALPEGAMLTTLGAISIAAGGILAWWQSQIRAESGDARPYIILSAVGSVVLASSLSDIPGNNALTTLVNGAASWAFTVTALSVARSFDRRAPWWVIGYALLFANAIGLPASPGFAVRANLIVGVTSSADWALIAMVAVGETLTFAAIIRVSISPAKDDAPASPVAIATYIIAYVLAFVPPFVLYAIGRQAIPELTPPSLTSFLSSLSIAGGVLFALPVALAVALERLTSHQTAQSRLATIITGIVGLDWLYWLTSRLSDGIARALSGLTALLEGEGALLWALLAVVVAYVIGSGAL